MPASLNDIAHVIQLAVAPVFLLTGVGALLVCVLIAVAFIDAFLREIFLAVSSARSAMGRRAGKA